MSLSGDSNGPSSTVCKPTFRITQEQRNSPGSNGNRTGLGEEPFAHVNEEDDEDLLDSEQSSSDEEGDFENSFEQQAVATVSPTIRIEMGKGQGHQVIVKAFDNMRVPQPEIKQARAIANEADRNYSNQE